jgi:hypothetical protein
MTVGPQWIDLSGSIVVTRMAGIGATLPLARASAKDGSPPNLAFAGLGGKVG